MVKETTATQAPTGTYSIDNLECLGCNLTTGTALIKSGATNVYGVVINSHTSGTMAMLNGTTLGTGNLMHGTWTFATGERFIDLKGELFPTGLFVQVGANTNVTVLYR